MTTITREQLIEKLQNRIAVTANYPGVEEAQLDAAIFKIALASLDADKPELKIAGLINKFYERYPLASFNKDTDRAEALGYFLAGAELQCFGEFIKYEELFGDE
ncbi:hypothetical protein C0X58_03320 [Salmonella enterica]|uniref:Gp38 n=1 Tax=Salmonella enterica subsp. arizonae TaxID=59203 RepID=A0A379S4H8_SALER|nr:hypothetical protein [Salmonella enterica]EAV6589478.1 hypothetical protein [Salmonella enterica subsp. arizonae serovar 63:z4,z23:-]EDW8109587.1 hypothetical protein [Salmonella enterica subsp. enterica serovar 4,[5],12:i:-]EEA2952904.1 hypothetical protein [Salmonella enterica subsp. enterica serovar Muenchen]EGE4650734.1 hypothetical protein [Salmonella enterica subsp. arizonae serovar 41:z4,z23:- str. 01-0089]EJU7777776.1 hypothetical protein [Salmonella enterica subsp. arizonae serovar